MADIVQLNTHLASPDDLKTFLAMRIKYFPEKGPATTTLIGQMVRPEFLLEIEVMAVVD